MKRLLKFVSVSFTVLLLPVLAGAQTCVGGLDPNCSPDDPCPCPIDSGLIFLIAAAVAIAFIGTYRAGKRKMDLSA